jgi:hypothetical protein
VLQLLPERISAVTKSFSWRSASQRGTLAKGISMQASLSPGSFQAIVSQHKSRPTTVIHFNTNSDGYFADACLDVLKNEAPATEKFTAEQDLWPYFVAIRGVAGSYFVEAADHDDASVFSGLEEARSRLHLDFGEFVIESDD